MFYYGEHQMIFFYVICRIFSMTKILNDSNIFASGFSSQIILPSFWHVWTERVREDKRDRERGGAKRKMRTLLKLGTRSEGEKGTF